MKTVGNLVVALSVIVFGITAVMRRIMTAEDQENLGLGGWGFLLIYFACLALMLVGYLVQKHANHDEQSP